MCNLSMPTQTVPNATRRIKKKKKTKKTKQADKNSEKLSDTIQAELFLKVCCQFHTLLGNIRVCLTIESNKP